MNQQPEIKAVVFDMGGVILRTMDKRPRAELAARFGMTYDEIDALVFGSESSRRATLGEISQEAHWQSVAEHLGLDSTQLAQFRKEFWAGDRADKDLMNFIAGLRPALKTAVLSNAWPGTRETATTVYGIPDIFDTMVFSAEEGMAKPDPRIYRLVLARLDAEPEQSIFVDDFQVNIDAAQALGMHAILFRSFEQFCKEFQAAIA